jgi:hypothetical protein
LRLYGIALFLDLTVTCYQEFPCTMCMEVCRRASSNCLELANSNDRFNP